MGVCCVGCCCGGGGGGGGVGGVWLGAGWGGRGGVKLRNLLWRSGERKQKKNTDNMNIFLCLWLTCQVEVQDAFDRLKRELIIKSKVRCNYLELHCHMTVSIVSCDYDIL